VKIIDRIQKYGDYSKEIHHKYANRAHWYLLSIAVDKKEQGKGHAHKLLKPVLDYLDKK